MRLAIVGRHVFSEYEEFLTGIFTRLIRVSLSFIAGIYLGSGSEVLLLIPGLMVLVTRSIHMSGAVAGVLTPRLSSAMLSVSVDVR